MENEEAKIFIPIMSVTITVFISILSILFYRINKKNDDINKDMKDKLKTLSKDFNDHCKEEAEKIGAIEEAVRWLKER